MRHIFLSRDCKGWHNVFDGVGIEPTLHLPKKCVLSSYTNYRSNHPYRYAILDFKELKIKGEDKCLWRLCSKPKIEVAM